MEKTEGTLHGLDQYKGTLHANLMEALNAACFVSFDNGGQELKKPAGVSTRVCHTNSVRV